MTEKTFIFQIGFTYLLFALFLYFTIDSVATNGWDFFSVLFALFSTNDFVRATRLLQVYIRIKKNTKS